MNIRSITGVWALLALGASSLAQAHFVWLERDGTGPVRGYFGEWNNELIEKSGGALDHIASPHAFTLDASQTLPLSRGTDHFDINVKGHGDVRLTDSIVSAKGIHTSYYAKVGRSETTPVMDLEIVPSTGDSNTLAVIWKGAPLKKQEVEVYGPPRWQKTLTTDENGQVRITTPWRGRYIVEAIHPEELPAGAAAGTAPARHVATLSFTVARGAAAPAP